jgi:NADPH2:quinone reductase
MDIQSTLPKENQIVIVKSFSKSGDFETITESAPILEQGMAFIKIVAAPISQFDILKISGLVPETKLPFTPGLEASGVIILARPTKAMDLSGKRVSFISKEGVIREYMTVPIEDLMIHEGEIDMTKAAVSFVNPITALGLLDTISKQILTSFGEGFIQTAANSSVGKMVLKLAKERNLQVINIVRSDHGEKELKELDAENILNLNDKDFSNKLKDLALKLKTTVCIDAISGELAGKIIKALPENGVYINYGTLSKEDIKGIDFQDLLSEDKTMITFHFMRWLKSLKPDEKENYFNFIKTNLDTLFQQEIGDYGSFWDYANCYKKFKDAPNKRIVS